jgi:hypothetical protein
MLEILKNEKITTLEVISSLKSIPLLRPVIQKMPEVFDI